MSEPTPPPYDFAQAEPGDCVRATFRPVRADDLKPRCVPIGWRGAFRCEWWQDAGAYAGQSVWSPACSGLLIPACDLADVVSITAEEFQAEQDRYDAEQEGKLSSAHWEQLEIFGPPQFRRTAVREARIIDAPGGFSVVETRTLFVDPWQLMLTRGPSQTEDFCYGKVHLPLPE